MGPLILTHFGLDEVGPNAFIAGVACAFCDSVLPFVRVPRERDFDMNPFLCAVFCVWSTEFSSTIYLDGESLVTGLECQPCMILMIFRAAWFFLF